MERQTGEYIEIDLLRLLGALWRHTVVIVLAGALWLFPNTFLLEHWLERVVLPGNLVAGFVLPGGALLLGALRGRV